MRVGQGEAGVALQQVITSPVLLATLAGILLRVSQLPIPPTVSPELACRFKPRGLPAMYLLYIQCHVLRSIIRRLHSTQWQAVKYSSSIVTSAGFGVQLLQAL